MRICIYAAGIAASLVLASPAAAQWWWPPTNGMAVEPACIDPQTPIEITLSGDWPHSCIPNMSNIVVTGNDIDFNVVRDPPPGICLTVITPWSRMESVGPLPVGTYSVYATYYAGTTPSSNRELMGQIVVQASCGPSCYADCTFVNGGTGQGLNVADFICFQTQYSVGNAAYADCTWINQQTGQGLNVADFICYQTRYALGCP